MGLRRILICLLSVLLVLPLVGCSSDNSQVVQPETRGKRGEKCQARNDCESGLACLNGVCAKNDFGLAVLPKQCDRVECQADVDCCGDKPQTAPAKCSARAATCDTPTIPGCVRTSCTSDATCMGGTCGNGSCSFIGGTCDSDTVCKDNCDPTTNSCTLSQSTCTADTDCLYNRYNATNVCRNRSCDCTNPDYNPLAAICSDPACKDVCLLRCDAELCVKDNSCKADKDCLSVGLKLCDANGHCAECADDTDCDKASQETCSNGVCRKPCTKNEECPIFDECQSGDCVYVGCKSDRECILAASGSTPPNAGTPITSSEDARLLKCLPSEADPTISTCKIPCENDGSCGSEFEVCDKGYCKFIGCQTDEECRAYLGLQNQMTTSAKPFVTKAVCRP